MVNILKRIFKKNLGSIDDIIKDFILDTTALIKTII
ncbi:hypothetical protein YN1_5140 [Nanoarchaeota archaeon]